MPLVVFDLASVETYFLVQPLSWLALEREGAVWCPFFSAPAPLDLDRDAAQRSAQRLGLTLNWPERHPTAVPRAMRMAALACARGCASWVVFALSTLAFGSGVDLERLAGGAVLDDPDPAEDRASHLPAIEAETGLAASELERAGQEGSEWDVELRSIAGRLTGLGISSAPALRWHGEVYSGSRAIAPVLAQSPSLQPSLWNL